MRASVRSRRRWRMISWPAAKQIRWVNPSIATVSPSRTSSATASCIDATLESAIVLAHDRRSDGRETLRLLAFGRRRTDVEVHAVLHRLALRHDEEQQRKSIG